MNKKTLKNNIIKTMSEIRELLELDYKECVAYLIHKYGSVNKTLLDNDEDLNFSVNDFSSIREKGLFVHHIDEYEIDWLAKPNVIRKYPDLDFEEKLVYCNLLEHMVLHIKIWQKTNRSGGYLFSEIIPELNDIFSGIIYKESWKNKAASLVRNYKDDYFFCLSKLKIHLKDEVNLLLVSSKDNEEIGWSKEKNEALFNEIKAYFKYDKLLKLKKRKVFVTNLVDNKAEPIDDNAWKRKISHKIFWWTIGSVLITIIFILLFLIPIFLHKK
ncbi:hypothetical protein [Metamycoplasma auris]|uniref:Uncharacterized protein n=1 Tax=Metamycoplasma auris TaxID=51363 RepID=A0A2W7G0L1_9BACT|nr:hypothetical protein [Metamycoplasma auris]PZV98750.1 hypothetical protein BCF89_1104 [Metamycoplasma auris]